ncbi:MAG: hypothetical protein HDS27_02860 [Bacteroides sp.]|nr:hypothetical protein [Bacteroides sp.]
MDEVNKLSLRCPTCGKEFKCKSPNAPGDYSVACPNQECKAKVSFRFPIEGKSQQTKKNTEVRLGLLDDGSYRFLCKNDTCQKSVLVPAKMVKSGHNKAICPNCKTPHEFDVEPKESDLLKCQIAGCGGLLLKPDRGDGIYSSVCDKCKQEYSIIIQGDKVVKVAMKTSVSVAPKRQTPMKLVSGTFISKKEYPLTKGSHYIGRQDEQKVSDFSIKDKYASSRSVRIDVNENGGRIVYRMTVERAMNPVYHNNSELTVGDIVYLTYGDTIKLGKTLIKVQKATS